MDQEEFRDLFICMFSFLQFINDATWEQRKVAQEEFPWGMISTCRVLDGELPFETAIKHPAYNDGELVVVQAYHTIPQAQAGHARWIRIMTADKLPDKLVDCLNVPASKMLSLLGDEDSCTYTRKDGT